MQQEVHFSLEPIETAPKDCNIIGQDEDGSYHEYYWEPDRYAKKPRPFWMIWWSQITHSRGKQPVKWIRGTERTRN